MLSDYCNYFNFMYNKLSQRDYPGNRGATMTGKVGIFGVDEENDYAVIVGEIIFGEDGEPFFSQRTPQELVDRFTRDGLPLPRYLTVKGLRARISSMLKGEVIYVALGHPYFLKALEHYNDKVCKTYACGRGEFWADLP